MYWHITLASEDRLALFPSDQRRRQAAVLVARVGGADVPLFCVADDHLHAVVRATRPRAGRIAANLSLALRKITAAPLDHARIRPVQGRGHLQSLVGYVLDQTSHHDLVTAEHPALWPGSAFQDLVGARLLPGFDPNGLREALPRLQPAEVFAAVRLPVLEPASDEVLSGLGVDALAGAAAEVVGQESLALRRANAARAVIASLGARLGIPTARVARVLGTTERHVRRLASGPSHPPTEAALRLRVAVQREVRSAGS